MTPPTEEPVLANQADSTDEGTLHYNTLPISVLSHEILVEIFDQAQRDKEGEREALRLLKILWVCCHWRNVALDAPSLWAYIEANNAKYAMKMEFLTRSKQAKLDISLIWWMSEELALAVASQVHRIKDLSLIIGPKTGDLLETPAPILQVLQIQRFLIPKLLFSGIAPQLVNISLHYCASVTCSAIPACPLRILSIREPRPRFRLQEVVQMLSRFPALESAYLQDIFDDSHLDEAALTVVNLPKLNFLHFGEVSIQLAIQLLKQVRLNSFTRLSAMIIHNGVTTANIMELFWLSVTAGSSLIQKLRIQQGSTSPYGHSHLILLTASQVENWIDHRLSLDEIMSILRQLPLDQLKDVELSMFRPPPPPEIWIMMANAPIYHLHLGYNAASTFIPFISSPFHDNDAIPFASLRSLVLEDVYDEAVFSEEVWRSFCDIFRARSERGLGLKTLRLKSDRSAEEFPMESLTNLIPNVKVYPL